MINLFHDFPLIDNRFYFLLPRQLILSHNFHCIQAACIFLPNENDPAECTSTNNFNLLEVMSSDFKIRICKCTLSESKFCKMSSQKFVIFQCA